MAYRNRGFGRFNEPARAPELLGAPSGGHTCTVHAGFSIAGDVISEHEKHQSPWRLGTHWGAYIRPGSRPFPKPHPLPASALGTEATEGPQVTAEPGPPEPCYAADDEPAFS